MIFRVVALITAISGVVMILSRWTSYQYAPAVLRGSVPVAGIALTLWMAAMMLVPVLKIGVALGLWGGHRRAWAAALIVLSVDFLLLASSVIRFHSITAGGFGEPPSGMAASNVVQVDSLWPSYITAALSLGSLFVLAQRSVRGEWARQHGAA